MFGGQGSGGPQGSKNPYASSQAAKSLSATFSSQNAPASTWQSKSTSNPSGSGFSQSGATTFGGGLTGGGGGFSTISAGQASTGFGSSPGFGSASTNSWNPKPVVQFNHPPGPFSSNHAGSQGFNNTNNASSSFSSSAQHSYKCRVCQAVFPSSEELKKHIKSEGHFDTSRTVPQAGGTMGAGSNVFMSGNRNIPNSTGQSGTSNLFGRPSATPASTSSAFGSSPFSQSASTPFNQAQAQRQGPFQDSFDQGGSRMPRGPPPPPPSQSAAAAGSQAQKTPWAKPPPPSSQDARSMHNPQPPRPRATFGQAAQSSLGSLGPAPNSSSQDRPFAPSSRPTFGSIGGASSHPFVPANNTSTSRPLISTPAHKSPFGSPSAAAPSGGTGFGALSAVQEEASADEASVPGGNGSGSNGQASDADYVPSSADNGDQDDDSDDQAADEEDDLNFSFSSQESGTGDQHSDGNSPMKASLGSPAAAARSRGEVKTTLRDLIASPGGPPSSTSAAPSGPAGATSSLMGFMKASTKFPAAAPSTTSAASHQAQLSSSSNHGSDTESVSSSAADAMGTCEDMCPAEERQKRLNESDVHKLEIPHPAMTPGRMDNSLTMVKKFQRSSADHALQIPHLLRTPEALLRTIEYIENELMDRAAAGVVDPRIGEAPTTLFIYLFVWDRYRMVAKDFTLQQSLLPLTRIWVECHERMARWFILMDHKMQAADDFISAGHGQQNGEQLNNLLKTLHGYYFRSRAVADASTANNTTFSTGTTAQAAEHIDMPNKAEFVCYFVLFQLGNGGEVSKYLQQLPDEILNSGPLRFAIEVWGALKTQNFAKYFRLLRTRATLLQACLMHRYVGEVRLVALKRLTRSLNPPGTKPQEYLLGDLMRLFMFESVAEAAEFIEHCGLTLCPSNAGGAVSHQPPAEDWVVLLSGQNIDLLLPRDKNDRAILPSTYYMGEAVDRVKCLRDGSDTEVYSIAEVCRGFATGGSQPVVAPAARAALTHSALTHSAPAVKVDGFGMRAPITINKAIPPAVSKVDPAPIFAPTTTVAPSTTIDKSALKAKLLGSSLGSGRGPKAATSPIAPVSDADVWGPADSANKKPSENNKSTKRISPANVSSSISSNGGSSASGSEASSVSGGWAKKTIAPSVAGVAGGGWGSDSGKAAAAFAGNSGGSGFGTGAGTGTGTSATTDSWRRSAPVAGKDAPKEGSFGGSSSSSSSSGGQKVSSFGAPAFPALSSAPFTASSTDKLNAFPAFPAAPVSAPASTSTTSTSISFTPKVAPVSASETASFALKTATPPTTVDSVPTKSTLNPNVPAFNPSQYSSQKLPDADFSSVASGALPSKEKQALPLNHSTEPSTNTKSAEFPPAIAAPTAAPVAPQAPTRPPVDQAKLDAFQTKMARKEQVSSQKSVLLNWQILSRTAAISRQKMIAALYFLFWKQSHRRSVQVRENFLSDIKSIKIVDPLVQSLNSLNLFGEQAPEAMVGNTLKRKQFQQAETQRQLKTVAENESQVRFSLLCDLPGADAAATTDATVHSVRSAKSLLDALGRTLRLVKTCQLRSLLGLPVAQSVLANAATSDVPLVLPEGPAHTGALCFKLAVVSGCATAGVACKSAQAGGCRCGGFSNAFRAELSNERGYGYTTASHEDAHSRNMTKAQLGKMKKRRGVLARALATSSAPLPCARVGMHSYALDATTTLHLSVVDVCGAGASAGAGSKVVSNITHSGDSIEQVRAVSDVNGAQAALIVVSTESTTQATAALNRVLSCAERGIPVVLVMVATEASASRSDQCDDEVSKEDIFHSQNPSSACSLVRNVLGELRAAVPDVLRESWLSTVQGAFVSYGSVPNSNSILQRALRLLTVNAEPVPYVARVRSADWLQQQILHSFSLTTSTPAGMNDEVATEQIMRGLCHEALASSIDRMNTRISSVSSALKNEHSRSTIHAEFFPSSDFLQVDKTQAHDSGYLPAGLLDLAALQSPRGESHESDLLLPRNWADVSKLLQVAEMVDSLHFPRWSSVDSICAYQTQLSKFAPDEASLPHSNLFVASLEEVLNRAFVTGQVAALCTSIDRIITNITRERLNLLVDAALPAYLYLCLDATQPGALLDLLGPSPIDPITNGDSVVELDDVGMQGDDIMMSPNGASIFEQAQYSQQAFPTGFGRSLFAQFSRDSVGHGAYSSPLADAQKHKRSFDTDSFADYESLGDHRRSSTESITGWRSSSGGGGGVEQQAQVHSMLFSSSSKRTKYHEEEDNFDKAVTPSCKHGVAYDKLFGEAKATTPVPSTPAAPTDPTTRALQSQMRSEQAAADRLNSLLETALSPVRSTPASGASMPRGADNTRASSGGSPRPMTQDPMQFIEQCRRERERFEAVVTL